MEAVKLKNVSFAYPESEYDVLQAINLTVTKGSFCLLMGESAAGKSTLLALLKKEIAPHGRQQGSVEINGTVGYLCQNVEESLVCDRVRAELAFGVENLGKTREEIELLIAETAAYFHLESKLDCEISALSGGEKQLVSLASVMMMKPDILVLDEPCAMLDPIAGEHFVQLVKKLHGDLGITVLMSEHSTELLYAYANQIFLLEQGRCAFSGTPAEMLSYFEKSRHPLLRAVPFSFRLQGKTLNVSPSVSDAQTTEAVLVAKGLWFAYRRGEDVLKDLSLKAWRGQVNAVIGCNGCGKTTLLKVLAGVRKPYRGKVKAEGRVSMLTQNVKDLFSKETCGEETSFGEITDFLGISDLTNRHPYDLSGGQAQRLALAKVLERNADIILLDEPTRGLDELLKRKLGLLLKRLCQEGKTVILVSHDLDFVGEWCDYCSFISEGRIVSAAPVKMLFSCLTLYTTSLARLTGGRAVAPEDIADE